VLLKLPWQRARRLRNSKTLRDLSAGAQNRLLMRRRCLGRDARVSQEYGGCSQGDEGHANGIFHQILPLLVPTEIE